MKFKLVLDETDHSETDRGQAMSRRTGGSTIQRYQQGDASDERYVEEVSYRKVASNDPMVNLSDRIKAQTGYHIPPFAIVFAGGVGTVLVAQQFTMYLAAGTLACVFYLLHLNKKKGS